MSKSSTQQKNVPELRFPMFSGEWKKLRLGQLGQVVTGLTYNPNAIDDKGTLVLRSSNVQDRQLVFSDNVYVRVSSGDFNPVKQGDILICVRNGSRNLIGKNALITKDAEGMAFGAFMSVFRGDSNHFVYQWFDSSDYLKEIHKNLGATINSINGSDLKKFIVYAPTSEEQSKIAGFLFDVDEYVTNLKEQKTKLEEYKRGMMQKIFSREVCFKDENGKNFPDWQTVKFGKLISEHRERSATENQHPMLTSSRNGIVLQSDYYGNENRITTRTNLGSNVIPVGFISYRSRSDDGRFFFNVNETGQIGLVSIYYPVFSLKEGPNQLLKEFLNFNWKLLYKYSVGTSQKVLSMTDLKSITITYPTIKEQEKIINFISALDALIKAKTEQVDKAEIWKRGLLQKMFV